MGGGVVLVLADEATVSEMSCGSTAGLGDASPGRAKVRYERMADIAQLGSAISSMGSDVIAVVLDPEVAAPDDETALRVAAQLTRTGRELRVVVYPAINPQAMHAVYRLSLHRQCELVVRAFDALPGWTRGAAKGGEATPRRCEAVQQLTTLPVRFRRAWIDALAAPGETTVKRVLACASVERRTLERAHEEAGVLSPARLLRALKAEDG